MKQLRLNTVKRINKYDVTREELHRTISRYYGDSYLATDYDDVEKEVMVDEFQSAFDMQIGWSRAHEDLYCEGRQVDEVELLEVIDMRGYYEQQINGGLL